MILWIDEFGEPHTVDVLDESMIKAMEHGLIDVYRFDLDTKKYQKHNGTDWVAVE